MVLCVGVTCEGEEEGRRVISGGADGRYVKVIHVHHDLTQMFITLVWNDQQPFSCTIIIIILPILFCVYQISIHCFIIELQYNHVLTL